MNNECGISLTGSAFLSILPILEEGVLIQQCNAGIQSVNPAAERMLGIDAAELIGQPLELFLQHVRMYRENGTELHWPDFPSCVAARTGEPQHNVVIEYKRQEGVFSWLSISAQPLGTEGAAAPYAVATVFRDVAAPKLEMSATRGFHLAEEQQRVIQASLDGFWVASATDGRILETNEAFCRMVGYSREELLRMGIKDLEAHESPAEIAAHIGKVLAKGGDRFETRHRHRDGHLIDLEISVSHSEMDGGVNFVFVRDITERKRMESELRHREQEFRSLAESSPDAIIRYDCEGRIRYLNSNLELELGYTIAELYGKLIHEVWPDGRFAEIETAMWRAIRKGEVQTIVVHAPINTLKYRYHQIRIAPERDEEGRIVGALAFGSDVTGIRDDAIRFGHFIENLPGMAYTLRLTPDGHAAFPFVSGGIEDFFGLKPEEVKDDMAPLHTLVHPEDRPRIEAAIAEAVQAVGTKHVEFRVIRPGLPERWLDMRFSVEKGLQVDDGLMGHGIMLDITGRKHAQQQLELLDRAINQSSDTVLLVDDEACLRYVNDGACRSLGYSREELLTMSPADIDPDLTREQIIGMVHAGTGKQFVFESRHRNRAGEIFPVELSGATFMQAGRKFTLVTARNIAERKRMENELRLQTEFQRTLLDAINEVGMQLMIIENGKVVYINNRQLAREFGLTDVQIETGVPLLDYIHPDDKARIADIHRRRLAGEEVPSGYELSMLTPSGERKEYEISASIVPDSSPVRTVVISKDITERKEAERQLREFSGHLLAVREEEKTWLARELHDDLGSQLLALNLRLSSLLSFGMPDELKNTTFHERLGSMSQILESVISATRRIITGMRPEILDNLGLFAALRWHAEQFRKHSGIECNVVCRNDHGCKDCKGCEYKLDARVSINLFRIFQEALSNVARHSGATRVDAMFTPVEDEVVLTISDNGCGLVGGKNIAATSYGMRGMRERVAYLGGKIAFDSPESGGLCITVRVPRLSAVSARAAS